MARARTVLPLLLTLLAACEGGPVAAPDASHPVPPPPGAVLLAAGDIADCGSTGDEATAALVDHLEGTVLTLGDNAYPLGLPTDFRCYEASWGRHRARTRPVPGNHDYSTPGALAYYGYFGAAAGPPLKGYYSFEAGAWHVVALNSEIEHGAGSAQEKWLRADLAAHPSACALAYMHRPRFSSGSEHGSDTGMQPIWQALYDAGAEVVLSGHDHDYERFAPLRPDGSADAARGLRQFVVGTGGKGLRGFGARAPGSEARYADGFGLLRLALDSAAYHWEFLTVDGALRDSGSAACH